MENWKNRELLLIIAILVPTLSVAGAASVTLIPKPPCANVHGTVRVFTIIADLNGYNGSKNQEGNGPLMTVQTCDTIVLNFLDRDLQAHGLSVDFYAVSGLQAVGGESLRVQFLALKPGEFRVFCNTLCSVHNYMQNAKLTVGCCSTGCCS